MTSSLDQPARSVEHGGLAAVVLPWGKRNYLACLHFFKPIAVVVGGAKQRMWFWWSLKATTKGSGEDLKHKLGEVRNRFCRSTAIYIYLTMKMVLQLSLGVILYI